MTKSQILRVLNDFDDRSQQVIDRADLELQSKPQTTSTYNQYDICCVIIFFSIILLAQLI